VNIVVQALHLDTLGSFGVFADLSLFLILIHIGFASAISLTSALLPIMIARRWPQRHGNGHAARLRRQLWIHSADQRPPQNMVCLGTETFTSRQFTKIGLWLTGIGYALMLIFALT